MTTEERLRQSARILAKGKPRPLLDGLYLDELLDRAADELRDQAKTIGDLAIDLASARSRPDAPDWETFLFDARLEALRAIARFPQPNNVLSKFAEEAGEVVKAAIHCAEGRETIENVRAEMRQAIAMLFRLWLEGDEIHGLPPVRPAHFARSRRRASRAGPVDREPKRSEPPCESA
ncbi:MAG: hypothetical protein EKK59_06880 [Neisseriaceae bacterium]|nr:MAG: hypothetical protein EKK59_06880 [Neisseriaceae bacterium]